MSTESTQVLLDGHVLYLPQYLAADTARRLLATLRNTLLWEQHRVTLFGRTHDCPRLSAWYGDPGASYAYSGLRLEPNVWTSELRGLRDALKERLNVRFDGMLANWYRSGDDAMGWHRDNERQLDPLCPIAMISLGADRRLAFRRHGRSRQSARITLANGSLLWMAADLQRDHEHALPRQRSVTGERISLSFRKLRFEEQRQTFSTRT